MTGGDDILYLITLRNLEIHLVIGLCCFEVCFWDRAFNWLAMVPITTLMMIVITNIPLRAFEGGFQLLLSDLGFLLSVRKTHLLYPFC